jgi:hypothetical protein
MKLACLYLVLSHFTSPSYFAGQSCIFTLLILFYACMDKSTLRLSLDEQPNSTLLSFDRDIYLFTLCGWIFGLRL